MARVQLRPGVRFWFKEGSWEVLRRLPEGRLAAKSLTFGHEKVFDWQEFSTAFKEGLMRFEVMGKAARTLPTSDLAYEYEYADFQHIPDKRRDQAWLRYRVLKPLVEIPKGLRIKQDVIDRLEEVRKSKEFKDTKLPTTYQTLYEWIRDFESSGYDVRALVPAWNKRGRQTTSLPPEFLRIVDEVIRDRYLRPERPSLQHACELIRAQLKHENRFRRGADKIPVPAPDTLYMRVYRRVQELDPTEVMAKRYGIRVARAEFDAVKEGVSVERVLERVQIDHTKLDVFLVDDQDRLPIGRPTLTYCHDERSKYPLGFYVGFEPPSYYTVMQALRHAILPKEDVKALYPEVKHSWDAYGLPETLVVDNGKEFLGKSLEDACLQLNIELVHCPVRTPHFKGAVERFFGSINRELLHTLPGTSFSNVLDRGDYDPAKQAVISYSSFMELLHIFLVDYYSERPMSDGLIPARAWAEGCVEYPPAIPPNRDELTILLGRVEHRTIQRQGIELECLFYDSEELRVLRTLLKRKESVKVKSDPSDLSRVWVYDHVKTNRWIEARCTRRDYAQGLTLWKHRVIKRYAREVLQSVDYDALAEAKLIIQNIVDREYTGTKKKATRSKMARWGVGTRNVDALNVSEVTTSAESDRVLPPTSEPQGVSDASRKKVKAAQPKSGQRSGGGEKVVQSAEPNVGAHAPASPEDDDLDLQGWGVAGSGPNK